MAKTRKKLTDEEKIVRRREQKKLVMRKLRSKVKKNPIALEEKRKKDREYYYRKKNEGKVKTIKDLNSRDQRNLRKKWREDAKKKREIMKMQRRTEQIIIEGTPLASPVPPSTPISMSNVVTTAQLTPSSTSRVDSGKSIAARNRKILKSENIFLRQKLQALENKLAKYRMREHRIKTSMNKDKNKSKSQHNKENVKLSCNPKITTLTITKIQTLIKNFLTDDENSRLTAGKKETITRNKDKKQIRLLNDTLLNLHDKFKKNTGLFISYKTFCRYRPFWVHSPKASSRDTCLCSVHENMSFVVQALKSAKIIKENSALEAAKTLCCNGHTNEKCLERKCLDCSDKVVETGQYEDNDSICYQRWVTKKVAIQIKGVEKMCQKTIKERVMTNIKSLIDIFYEKMPLFMQHLANIYHQTYIVRKLKQEMSSDQGLLHCDFSENYQCKYGTEVQAAHFAGSKAQLSLHTTVFYYKNNEDDDTSSLEHKSFCTISENLRHDPILICAHLKPVIEKIKSDLVPDIRSFHILSDGPSTQYKNKTMFFLLVDYLSVELGAEEIHWHFSESGHGKGAPDGVGGCLKRTADREVALNRDVSDMQSLVHCLQKNVQAISVIPIDDSNIAEIEKIVNQGEVRPFKGTLRIHHLTWHKSDPFILHARRLSCLSCPANVECSHYEIGQIPIKSVHYKEPESDIEDAINVLPVTLPKRVWRYEDIYSDSSDDNIPLRNLQSSSFKVQALQAKTPKEDDNTVNKLIAQRFWCDSDDDDDSIF